MGNKQVFNCMYCKKELSIVNGILQTCDCGQANIIPEEDQEQQVIVLCNKENSYCYYRSEIEGVQGVCIFDGYCGFQYPNDPR